MKLAWRMTWAAAALLAMVSTIALNGCLDSPATPEDEDWSNRGGDMRIDGFRNESTTTGTIKNILVAEYGYMFAREDQMDLYNLRLSMLEPVQDAAEGEPTFRVTGVLTATTGTYYLDDKDFGEGVIRHQGDLDLHAPRGDVIVYDSPDQRLQVQELMYYDTQNNALSTSRTYVQYQHDKKIASGHEKGFTRYIQSDGDQNTFGWGRVIKYEYERNTENFDTSGAYVGPDPREIPKPRKR
ncbi:hypothetical protein JXA32_16395 [Candidatus Sumerlaeota bacterium]|nr:hypothetical protein [Candidatus Sumerlaeota bacterium]